MNTTHIVRHGETLTSIARRYGANVRDLERLNSITDPKKLAVGATLRLPAFRPFDTPAPKNQSLSNKPTTDDVLVKSWVEEFWDDKVKALKRVEKTWHELIETVVHPIREQESAEAVHVKSTATLKKRSPAATASSQQKKAHPGKASEGKLHRDEVLQKLKERLEGITPVMVVNKGVQLTPNERKKIVAGIGLCEVSNQVFSSQNTDQEFIGRKFGKRGIETSYSRIVHIGLSYGYIQFTQDSGSLGKLLNRMRDLDRTTFDNVFRNIGTNNKASLPAPNIDLLIRMTTEGLSVEEVADSYRPVRSRHNSGQEYWGSIRKTKEGYEISKLANQDRNHDNEADLPESREIRGPRVHPIPYRAGDTPEDIWRGNWALALIELGKIPKFQDVQLEQAVDDYFSMVLPHCARNNIRTAKALAFVGACRVRGAKESTFIDIGAGLGYTIPFERNAKELELLKVIADSHRTAVNGRITLGGITFDADEARRSALLLKNEFNFLDEDYYDIDSYS